MELDQIKNMSIPHGALVELMWDDRSGRGINPAYYLRIIEELPEMFKTGHKTPPYVEFAFGKDRNGVHKDIREYIPNEILKLEVHGPSRFV